MLIENPRYYTYEEMEKEFDGYCVCVVYPELDERTKSQLLGGVVIAYDPWMNNIYELVHDLREQGAYSEDWLYTHFTHPESFDSGIVEVVFLED
ncbi:MAG: hypothetical protein LBE35_09215 [Clostridiales bacterium]|jgi:hypothetical protein|nr:hypothetical protein [Clostridiales bacterium]